MTTPGSLPPAVPAALVPLDPAAARPTVDDVAVFIRARTKDDAGNEVGTFDDATRPTATQVEEHIDAAADIVGLRLPAYDVLPAVLGSAIATVTALEAACQIEKGYWPEQALRDRSAYALLRAEADAALDALAEQAGAAAGGGTEFVSEFASYPVASWTSMR